MVIIYLLRHRSTGRSYVGRTRKPLIERFLSHVHTSRQPVGGMVFHLALNAYGEDSFEVLEIAKVEPHLAIALEREAIIGLGTRWPAGFNVRPCSMAQMRRARREARAEFPIPT